MSGAGAASAVGTCWSCAAPLGSSGYGRGDSCPKCGRDTRCCRGCAHYDRGKHNECRENQAERVVDKERSNFCDYFKPAARLGGSGSQLSSAEAERDAARAAAEALFRKKTQ